MSKLEIDDANSLYYDYHASAGKPTIVFVNALTGSTDHWESVVAPKCRAAGYGTLSYNMRGQVNTNLGENTIPDCDLIVADLQHLLAEIKPELPVFCGLSIGGLYALKAVLAGQQAAGLILLNTLREIGPRLSWLNEGMVHVLDTGGFALMLDMYLPLLTSEDFHKQRRNDHLKGTGYSPESKNSGAYRLMQAATQTDWKVDYTKLQQPVLSISGTQDRVFYDKAIIDKLGAQISDWQHLQWDDAGHLLPLEVPEKLADAVIDFVNRLA